MNELRDVSTKTTDDIPPRPPSPREGNARERDRAWPADQPLTMWERLSFGTTHAILSGLLALGSLRTLETMGRGFGTLEWLINYRRRRRFSRALAGIIDDGVGTRERRRISRAHFMQTRCDKIFYLVFDRIPPEQAPALFSIRNRHMIDEALAQGRGVYVALSHHGAHHVAAMLMAACGYKVAGVRDRKESGLRRYVQARFDRLYPDRGRMRVIYADAYPRDIYRCFQDGFVLGSAMDVQRIRHPNQKVEKLPLFGQVRPFVSGPLRVAIRCNAAVLQGFIVPRRGLRYELDITGSLLDPENDEGLDEDEAVRRALTSYVKTIERYIRAHPSLITRT